PCGPHGRKSKLRWLRSCARSVKHPTTPPRSRSNAKGNVPRSTESTKRGEFHGRRRLPQHHSADRRRAARGGPCRTQPGRGGAGHLRARRPPAHAVRRVAHDQRRGPPLAADQHPPGDHQPDHRRAPGPARPPAHRRLRPPGPPTGGSHAAASPARRQRLSADHGGAAAPIPPARANPPVVRTEDGYYEFYLDGMMVYDFKPSSPGNALRWIQHMAGKSWVTKRHIEWFARMVADEYGERYN